MSETPDQFFSRLAFDLDARGHAAVDAGDDCAACHYFEAADACGVLVRLFPSLEYLTGRLA